MTAQLVAEVGALPAWEIRTVFQPIVELHRGTVVGAEAFSRDRTGACSIVSMLEQARGDGTIVHLDQLCQRSAIDAWLGARTPKSLALFLNVEPSSLVIDHGGVLFDDLERTGTQVVVEITERDLLCNPLALLDFRDRVTDRGWGLAVDDIGVDPKSLAVLPLLAPEVLKLDMQLLHRQPDSRTARIVSAVLAQAERTGATILAEGIETQEHLDLARSVGATLGQGWLFGRPADLPPTAAPPQGVPPNDPGTGRGAPLPTPRRIRLRELAPTTAAAPPTPWQLVADRPEIRRAGKPILSALSAHIERQVSPAEPATIVLGAFQNIGHVPPTVFERYSAHGKTCAFVGILGSGTAKNPGPGLRGQDLEHGDPMLDEWTVVVISPYLAVALVARDTRPATPDIDIADSVRQFDYLLTHDRDLVVEVARVLIARFTV